MLLCASRIVEFNRVRHGGFWMRVHWGSLRSSGVFAFTRVRPWVPLVNPWSTGSFSVALGSLDASGMVGFTRAFPGGR